MINIIKNYILTSNTYRLDTKNRCAVNQYYLSYWGSIGPN